MAEERQQKKRNSAEVSWGTLQSVCSRAYRGAMEPRLEESGENSWGKLSRQRWKVSQEQKITYGRSDKRFRHLAAGTLPAPPGPPSLLHWRFLRRLVSGDRLNWFDGWSKRFSIF